MENLILSRPPSPDKHTIDAVTLLREVLTKIEGWQCGLHLGKLEAVLKDMGGTGCGIDDFLDSIQGG